MLLKAAYKQLPPKYKANEHHVSIQPRHNFGGSGEGRTFFKVLQKWGWERVLLYPAYAIQVPGGGHLGIFSVGMYRPGLQIVTPFKKIISPKIDTPF